MRRGLAYAVLGLVCHCGGPLFTSVDRSDEGGVGVDPIGGGGSSAGASTGITRMDPDGQATDAASTSSNTGGIGAGTTGSSSEGSRGDSGGPGGSIGTTIGTTGGGNATSGITGRDASASGTTGGSSGTTGGGGNATSGTTGRDASASSTTGGSGTTGGGNPLWPGPGDDSNGCTLDNNPDDCIKSAASWCTPYGAIGICWARTGSRGGPVGACVCNFANSNRSYDDVAALCEVQCRRSGWTQGMLQTGSLNDGASVPSTCTCY